MSRIRVAIVAIVMLIAGALVGSLLPAGAVGPGSVYKWQTSFIFIEPGTSVNVGGVNNTGSTQNITYRMKSTLGTTLFSGSFNISAGDGGGQSHTIAGSSVVLEFVTNSDKVVPRGSFVPPGGATKCN